MCVCMVWMCKQYFIYIFKGNNQEQIEGDRRADISGPEESKSLEVEEELHF